MIRHCLLFSLLISCLHPCFGADARPELKASGTNGTGLSQKGESGSSSDEVPLSHAGQPVQGHPKAKASVPAWDELAHIHHFHRHRLKKLKKHYRPSVWLSKWLLLVTHAAVLFISYLHVTPH